METGQFYYAAKSFDALEKLDGSQEFWEGKRGACVGVYQKYSNVSSIISSLVSGLESRESLEEIITILKTSENSQVDV